MNNLRSPNMQSIGKRSNITLGAALSTDPAIGHEKRPPLPDAKDDPTVVGNMQSPRESARPWTPCLSPALAFHSPPFGGRGWGWVSGLGVGLLGLQMQRGFPRRVALGTLGC